jgi:hypothetical protein
LEGLVNERRDRTPVEFEVEQSLGIRLPDEYVYFLRATGGLTGWMGHPEQAYVSLYPLDRLLSTEAAGSMTDRFPGAFQFGDDGSRLVFLLDCREEPAPVWMTDIVGSGWEDADRQAPDLGSFLNALLSNGSNALNFGM